MYSEITIAGAATAGVVTSILVAPGARGVLGAALALTMLAIAVIDARHFIIPDHLNAAGFALAVLHTCVQNPQTVLPAIALAALRSAVLALLFLGMRAGYRWFHEREGIGLGDVKLAGVAGAWLDWFTMPLAVEIAAVTALAIYMVRQYIFGQSLDPTNRLPFGLFFAPAIWLGWLLETMALTPL